MSQIWSRFQNTNIFADDCANDIGLKLRSNARDTLPVDKEARLCSVTDIHRLLQNHFEDFLRMQADGRLVLYFKLNRGGTNVDTSFSPFSKPFERKMWGAVIVQ